MKAQVLIREAPAYRREAFCAGLIASGYTLVDRDPDLLVIWNRYDKWDTAAREVEARGGRVLVAENGYMGRDWLGMHWYAISEGMHNGCGRWHQGGARWSTWNISLAPWKQDGEYLLVLPQRGIGIPPARMPDHWMSEAVQLAKTQYRIKVRPHPGEGQPVTTLDEDLSGALACLTWASGAALKAIVAGVPVWHGLPQWIGAPAASLWGKPLYRGDRLPMLERMSWAMWSVEEIASGVPFGLLRASQEGL